MLLFPRDTDEAATPARPSPPLLYEHYLSKTSRAPLMSAAYTCCQATWTNRISHDTNIYTRVNRLCSESSLISCSSRHGCEGQDDRLRLQVRLVRWGMGHEYGVVG